MLKSFELGLYTKPEATGDTRKGRVVVGSGLFFVLFDPNIGFMHCKDIKAYSSVLERIWRECYPEMWYKVAMPFNVN